MTDAERIAELEADVKQLKARNKLLDKMNSNLELQMEELQKYTNALADKMADLQAEGRERGF